MSRQNRDVWCDHCDYRFSTQIRGNDGVGTCPNCGKPTLLVTCGVCENASELSFINFERGNWICPQCKEYRDFSAETLTDFLTAQIAIEPAERVGRFRRPSFRVGCGTLVLLYVFANVLLSSCGDLLSRRSSEVIVVEQVVTRVVEITATPPSQRFNEITAEDLEALPNEFAYIEYSGNGYKIQRHDLQTQTNLQILKPNGCGSEIKSLTWRPDEQGFLFTCRQGGETTLYLTSEAGIIELSIADGTNYETLALSPDGMSIAYTEANQRGLFVRQLDEMREVQKISSRVSRSPSWSPTGEQLAFVAGYSRLNDVHILTLNDSDIQNITLIESYTEHEPIWSPDGNSIVYDANYDGRESLYRYDVGTGEVQQLTDVWRTEFRTPTWTPDGEYIVFAADFDGDFDLYALDPYSDDKPIRLFDTPVDELYPTFQPANSTAEPTENTEES